MLLRQRRFDELQFLLRQRVAGLSLKRSQCDVASLSSAHDVI
jgi:hypothetical protein